MAVRHIQKTLVINTTIDGRQCLRECPYHHVVSVRLRPDRPAFRRPFCRNYGALKLNSPRHKKCLAADVRREAQ